MRDGGATQVSWCTEADRNNFNGWGRVCQKGIQPHSALTMKDDGEEEGLGARDQEVEYFVCNEIGLWLG